MIKDGRPYTCEGGQIDEKLLTDLPQDQIMKISKWIEDHIRYSNTPYTLSSYTLKLRLKQDTGIHITNNQFKDALILCGYAAADPDEEDWYFYIALRDEDINNPNPFLAFISNNRKNFNKQEQYFIVDASADPNFPAFANHDIILNYLKSREKDSIIEGYCRSSDDVIASFESLWKDLYTTR